jgi:hypothetical protein
MLMKSVKMQMINMAVKINNRKDCDTVKWVKLRINLYKIKTLKFKMKINK